MEVNPSVQRYPSVATPLATVRVMLPSSCKQCFFRRSSGGDPQALTPISHSMMITGIKNPMEADFGGQGGGILESMIGSLPESLNSVA